MSENTFETSENLEVNTSSETMDARALEDATHEPGARVEQTQDVSTAEAIEQVLTASMDQQDTGTAAGEVHKPENTARDPLTGKGSGPGEDTTGSGDDSSREPSAALEGDTPGTSTLPSTAQSVTSGTGETAHEADPRAGDSDPAVDLVDRDPVLDLGAEGQDPEVGGRITTEQAKPDPEKLGPENKPLERERVIGHGASGAVVPGKGNVPGKGKPPGRDGFPGGSSTSGGGAPVNNPGGHSGKPKEGNGYHSGSGPVGRWLLSQGLKNNEGYVEEPDGKGVWVMDENGDWWYQETDSESAPAETPPTGDPMDGDTPMPYTGSGGGGEDPDPDGPRGGHDQETGRVHPVLAGSGSDDSGGTPGDKDGEDDSGHFLGDPNLSGGDVRPPDDDIPYNKIDAMKKQNLRE